MSMSTSSHRMRLAVATAALAAAASLVTAVPAEAGTGDERRTISLRGSEPREGRFVIKGRVSPAYENRVATIQRKVGRSGRWSAWKSFRTTDASRYRQRIAALRRVGRVYYRVKVDASGDYRTAYSPVIFIRTVRG